MGRAIPLLETTLADRERVLGGDHPGILTSRNNLASAYWQAGRQAEAITIMQAVVTVARRSLSPNHEVSRQLEANLAAMHEAHQPAE